MLSMPQLLHPFSFQKDLLPLMMERFLSAKFLFSTFQKACKLLEETHFDSNKVIVTVTIPKNVRDISGAVFDSCEKLSSVTFKGQTPPRISIIFGSKINLCKARL